MEIFTGVRWRGGVKWEWGGRKWRFSLLSLAMSSESSLSRPHLLYYAMYNPLVALQWYRNTWPWMAALKSVSGSATNGFGVSSFRTKLFENLQSYPYTVSDRNVAQETYSGSIRFMQISAGVRWRGGVKWEWGSWKCRFSLHSFTVFRTFYTHGHTTALRWYDCQWPWAYFNVIGLFHIKFLKIGVWYGKSYYRQLIGNHTLFQLVPLLMTLIEVHLKVIQPRLSFPHPFQQPLIGMLSRRTVSQQ